MGRALKQQGAWFEAQDAPEKAVACYDEAMVYWQPLAEWEQLAPDLQARRERATAVLRERQSPYDTSAAEESA